MDIQIVGLFGLRCFWFILPICFTNAAPILIKGRLNFLAFPVDFNKTINGIPIFGRNKTFRGIIVGSLAGLAVFAIQQYLYQFGFFKEISLINYNEYSVFFGLLLGFGSLFGDLIESFIKRRNGIAPGQSWIPFDQIDFLIGALLFGLVFYVPSWEAVFVILIIGFCIHIVANYVGFLVGLRKSKV